LVLVLSLNHERLYTQLQ